jgi:phosphate transport system substrate-binding protein
MNDDFLHRLRTEPAPHFAANLKARLDVLRAASAPRRSSMLRTMLVAAVIGGVAFAVTAISIRGVPPMLLDLFKPHEAATAEGATASRPGPDEGELVIPDDPAGAGRGGDQPIPMQLATEPRAREELSTPGLRPRATALDSVPLSRETAKGGSSREVPLVVATQATAAFAKAIADELAGKPVAREVRIDNLRDGDPIKAFCTGPVDMAVAARRMVGSEFRACARNGMGDIHELMLGRQALVLVHNAAGPELKLSTREIYLALARGTNETVTMWQQIGAMPGYQQIEFIGPPADSTAGYALAELLMEPGCRSVPAIQEGLEEDPGALSSLCWRIRSDGLYVDQGQSPDLIAQRIVDRPGSIGVLHYSYFATHRNSLSPVIIDGVKPSDESIANGTYPGSRMLYVYAKDSSLRSGAATGQFLSAIRHASAPRGPLVALGLIPPGEAGRKLKKLTLRDLQP